MTQGGRRRETTTPRYGVRWGLGILFLGTWASPQMFPQEGGRLSSQVSPQVCHLPLALATNTRCYFDTTEPLACHGAGISGAVGGRGAHSLCLFLTVALSLLSLSPIDPFSLRCAGSQPSWDQGSMHLLPATCTRGFAYCCCCASFLPVCRTAVVPPKRCASCILHTALQLWGPCSHSTAACLLPAQRRGQTPFFFPFGLSR